MEAEDYAEAVRILAESPKSVRWEEYMAPIMEDESGDDYDPYDAYPDGWPEVFHWRVADRGDGRDTVFKEDKTVGQDHDSRLVHLVNELCDFVTQLLELSHHSVSLL